MGNEIITNEQLVEYLSKSLNTEIYKKVIASTRITHCRDFFSEYTNIISKYYISTLDNSIDSASWICEELFNYSGNDFFCDVLMPKIINVCSKQLSLNMNSISDYYKICELIKFRNKNNQFYTHCFPGALINEVKQNGLDVSKFKFKEELSKLNKYFRSGFKIGGLYYCELSNASLAYIGDNMPESVKFSLGGFDNNVDIDESNYELVSSSFKENIDELEHNNKINKEEKEELLRCGFKIIDFYCKTKKVGIAFFKKEIKPYDYEYDFNILRVSNEFGYSNFLSKKIEEIVDMMINDRENAFEIWDSKINKLCKNNDELRVLLNKIIWKHFSDYIQLRIISNINHQGFADGYSVPGGKLSRSEMGLLEIDFPRDLHVKQRKNNINLLEKRENKGSEDLTDQIETTSEIIEKIKKAYDLCNDLDSIVSLKGDNTDLYGYFKNGQLNIIDSFYVKRGNEIFISKYPNIYLKHNICNKKANEFISSGEDTSEIIRDYKNSDIYDENVDVGDFLLTSAVQYYFNNQFDLLPLKIQNDLLYQEALKHKNVTIKYANGSYYLQDGKNETKLKIDFLVTKTNSMYDSLYSTMTESDNNIIQKK